MILIRATDKYKKNNISDSELSTKYNTRYIPAEGEKWEVDEQRKDLLVSNGFAILAVETVTPEDKYLEDMTRDELFELASNLGIKSPKNTKTETLINKIKEKQNS